MHEHTFDYNKYYSTNELCPLCHQHPCLGHSVSDLEVYSIRVNPDMINHPSHYTHGRFETWEVIEDWGLGYHLGNALKYISRAEHKGDAVEDIKKAKKYLERWLEINNRGLNYRSGINRGEKDQS